MSIKEEALAHYDRMIEWAEKQDPDDRALSGLMHKAIGEYLCVEDCAYCREYCCYDCPLDCEGCGCCNSLTSMVLDAETWGEWLKYAKKVRAFIRKRG